MGKGANDDVLDAGEALRQSRENRSRWLALDIDFCFTRILDAVKGGYTEVVCLIHSESKQGVTDALCGLGYVVRVTPLKGDAQRSVVEIKWLKGRQRKKP